MRSPQGRGIVAQGDQPLGKKSDNLTSPAGAQENTSPRVSKRSSDVVRHPGTCVIRRLCKLAKLSRDREAAGPQAHARGSAAENPATVRHSPRTRRIPIRHIARPTGATRQAAAEPSRSPAASRPFVKRERTAVCGASSQLAESILMSTPVRLALNAELRPGSRPRNECRALAAKRPRNASLSILQILLDSASHASLQ